MNVPQLRVLGVGEMLDVALKIYWRNAWMLFRLVFLIVAPVSVLTSLVMVSATPSAGEDFFSFDEDTGEATLSESADESLAAIVAGFAIVILLGFVSTTLATGACFKAVVDSYLGQPPNWGTSLRYIARRLHSVLWITILGSLVTAIGFVFCIVPGVYLWAAFGVAIPVLLTEGVRGRHALGRSRQLVKDNWWRTFGVLLLGTILTAIVGGAIGALVGAVSIFGDPEGDSASSVAAAIFGDTISQTLTVPFTAALVSVLYVDLRVRKEAFDLQLLSQQIGVEPRPEYTQRVAPEPTAPAAPEEEEEPPFWPPPPGWKPQRPDDGS